MLQVHPHVSSSHPNTSVQHPARRSARRLGSNPRQGLELEILRKFFYCPWTTVGTLFQVQTCFELGYQKFERVHVADLLCHRGSPSELSSFFATPPCDQRSLLPRPPSRHICSSLCPPLPRRHMSTGHFPPLVWSIDVNLCRPGHNRLHQASVALCHAKTPPLPTLHSHPAHRYQPLPPGPPPLPSTNRRTTSAPTTPPGCLGSLALPGSLRVPSHQPAFPHQCLWSAPAPIVDQP